MTDLVTELRCSRCGTGIGAPIRRWRICPPCFRAHNAERARQPARRALQLAVQRRPKHRARRALYERTSPTLRAYRLGYNASELGYIRHREGGWKQRGIIDLTWARFVAAIEAQGGRCPIDSEPLTPRTAHPDHDPETGKFRAALCRKCNVHLVASNTLDTARVVVAYLARLAALPKEGPS